MVSRERGPQTSTYSHLSRALDHTKLPRESDAGNGMAVLLPAGMPSENVPAGADQANCHRLIESDDLADGIAQFGHVGFGTPVALYRSRCIRLSHIVQMSPELDPK